DGGEGARVEITGGTVIANSSNCAIGHGTTDHEMGTLSIDGKMKVQIGNDGTAYGVTSAAANRVKDCQEHKNARIEACDHPDNEYQKDSYLHVQKCSYCYTDFMTEKHTFSEVPGTAVEKTCVVEGKEADQKCDICGYVKTGAGTGYGAHEWNEPEYTWTDDNMYCTASRTCKADPGHQETEKVWSVFKISKAATCEENGEHTYMAPFSNEGFEMQTKIVEDIPAWGHDLKKVDAAEATCTKDGNIEHYKCARCGKFFADSEGTDELSEEEVLIEAPGHNWGDWTTISDATLSESGLKKRTCSVCDETDSMVIPPVNHDHILITVDEEKNCEKPGVKKHQKCEVCGALFDEDGVTQLSEHEVMILPIGHKEGERELGEVTPATCSDLGGYTTIIRCANCRRVLRIEHETLPFDKNAHSWDKGTVTLKPTLTKTGVRTFTCELCGEKKTAVIAKLKVNTLKVTGKTVKIKYAKLKKKAQTVTAKNAMTITKPVGTLTYKKVKGNGKITVNAKTGKITVKKGLKKGTYKVEIKVTAKGNALYGAGSKTPTVTIKVVK
ncbi:MAG: hypothetical protein Q4A48_06540, partial [Bacillota bacterium]|nr:hypothetical protein [Bacillota bacterium]